jgi:hypothetical protein
MGDQDRGAPPLNGARPAWQRASLHWNGHQDNTKDGSEHGAGPQAVVLAQLSDADRRRRERALEDHTTLQARALSQPQARLQAVAYEDAARRTVAAAAACTERTAQSLLTLAASYRRRASIFRGASA